jgi:AcrR family transcriptional regulator
MIRSKKVEIQEREARILELALAHVEKCGIAALSMELIAAELGMARGTVYNHFPNKEEILLALAIQAAQQRQAVFEHAVLMPGRSRQRMSAIGVACEYFADTFPALLKIEFQIRHDLVWEKISPQRQSILRDCESRCTQTVAGVIRDAVASGDLRIADPRMVEGIVFGLWSLVQGAMLLELTSPSLTALGVSDSRAAMRAGCNALMDGYGWQPLFEPGDYDLWRQQAQDRFANFQPLSTADILVRLKC